MADQSQETTAAVGAVSSDDVHVAPPLPGRAEYLALRALQVGAVAVVLAAVTWKEFELDRFYVPKELVLHVAAVIAGAFGMRAMRRLPFTAVDALLTAFVFAGALSAVFATNGWIAVRAVALSASGVIIFRAARALRNEGLAGPILSAVTFAVTVGVVTALLQTYGVQMEFFSLNRAPGGTLGNRNSIAHMAAFGLPVALVIALRATHWLRWLSAGIGATLMAGALVLTRSRAGFLACGAVLLVLITALFLSPALRSHGRTWVRLTIMFMLAGAGIAAAMILPNELNWRSDNPYLESLTGVANYREGSGRGRLVQYEHSMRMAVSNPLLGVGPGNWPVQYPAHAADNDPSLDGRSPGMTSNPWPSSDWVAFASERGVPGILFIALAVAVMAALALQQLMRGSNADEALGAAGLLGVLGATAVAGMFDAVLLLALPTLLVFAALGALLPGSRATGGVTSMGADRAGVTGIGTASGTGPDVGPGVDPGAGVGAGTGPRVDPGAGSDPGSRRTTVQTAATIVLVFISAVGALRSAAQLTAMGIYAESDSAAWLSRAAQIDPGAFRLHIRLARSGSGLNRTARCEHAVAARELFPNAREARNLSEGCD